MNHRSNVVVAPSITVRPIDAFDGPVVVGTYVPVRALNHTLFEQLERVSKYKEGWSGEAPAPSRRAFLRGLCAVDAAIGLDHDASLIKFVGDVAGGVVVYLLSPEKESGSSARYVAIYCDNDDDVVLGFVDRKRGAENFVQIDTPKDEGTWRQILAGQLSKLQAM